MNILFCRIPAIPFHQQPLRHIGMHIQKQHSVRFWQAKLFVFEICAPIYKCIPLSARQLTHLVNQI